VLGDPRLARDFQGAVLDAGVPAFCWKDMSYDGSPLLFVATQVCGLREFSVEPTTLEFNPRRPVDGSSRAKVEAAVALYCGRRII